MLERSIFTFFFTSPSSSSWMIMMFSIPIMVTISLKRNLGFCNRDKCKLDQQIVRIAEIRSLVYVRNQALSNIFLMNPFQFLKQFSNLFLPLDASTSSENCRPDVCNRNCMLCRLKSPSAPIISNRVQGASIHISFLFGATIFRDQTSLLVLLPKVHF